MLNKALPFVSIVLPAYNEEAIIKDSIKAISEYCKTKKDIFNTELLIINDGSKDLTGKIADELSEEIDCLRVIHHKINLNLGRALQTGFRNAEGDIIIVMDMDLSYSVDHIERLVETQLATSADVVVASPYMKGGKVTKVPYFRALLSRTVNRIMRLCAQEKFHTFTSMVRAYKKEFVKDLNLKTKDYEVNPEILYKAMILRAHIIEIPAHLDWSYQLTVGKKRTSGMRIIKTFFSGLMASFIFRPYIFFLGIGALLLILSIYIIVWIFINTFQIMSELDFVSTYFDDQFSKAIELTYKSRPHAFIVGGITLLAAIQVLSLGFISLQNKRYFEETFHINTSILKKLNKQE